MAAVFHAPTPRSTRFTLTCSANPCWCRPATSLVLELQFLPSWLRGLSSRSKMRSARLGLHTRPICRIPNRPQPTNSYSHCSGNSISVLASRALLRLPSEIFCLGCGESQQQYEHTRLKNCRRGELRAAPRIRKSGAADEGGFVAPNTNARSRH